MTINKGVSNLAICGYILNTNKVNTKLSRLVVLLRALNTIYRAISLLILGSLMIII